MTAATTVPAIGRPTTSAGRNAGVVTMIGLTLRTGWKPYAIWVVSIVVGYLATVAAIDSTFTTAEQFESYGATFAGDKALAAINGIPYGATTLGGVSANEFAFIAALAFPLMATHLILRATRGPEESGLLELVRSRCVARWAPAVAATILALGAFALVAFGVWFSLLGYGVSAGSSALYAWSLAGLGAVWTGVALCIAQWVRRVGKAYATSLVVLGAAYGFRAIGDVRDTAWKWLSPLAWQQETRPFAPDARWWPLALALAVAVALIAVGWWQAATRDLGSGLFTSRPGGERAGLIAGSTVGRAIAEHRGSILGWTAGGLAVAIVFGALVHDVSDAVAGNPSIGEALGDGGARGQAVDLYVALTVVILVLMAGGFVISAVGRLRADETGGRLETTLAQPISRPAWFGAEILVIGLGMVIVTLVPVLALGLVVAGQLSDGSEIGHILMAGIDYLPAIAVLAGFALLLFGWLPRWQSLAWLLLGYTTAIAFLGGILDLPDAVLRLSPMYSVGDVPLDDVSVTGVLVLAVVAVLLVGVSMVGFGRRDIPA